jgi:hypothetical protein
MQDQDPNYHPVNKLCQEALKKLGLKPDPDPTKLPMLQLMEWAFESGELRDTEGQIQATVESMENWKPAQVLEYVMGDRDDPMPEPEKNLPPPKLAYHLLDNLQARLVEDTDLFDPGM